MDKELARIFKKLKNRSLLGAVIGSVLAPPPNLRISIDDKIIIEKEQIYISSQVLKGYEREYELEGDLELSGKDFLLQATPAVINDTSISGSRPVTAIPEGQTTKVEVKGSVKGKGTIKLTDTLKKGDIVLMIASSDNQKFFLIDKGEQL